MERSAHLHIQDRVSSTLKERALTAPNALMPTFKRGEWQHQQKKMHKKTSKGETDHRRPKHQRNLVDDDEDVHPLRHREQALEAFVFRLSQVQLCE